MTVFPNIYIFYFMILSEIAYYILRYFLNIILNSVFNFLYYIIIVIMPVYVILN